MQGIECSNCEKEARIIRGSYVFTESGLDCVVLQGIEIAHCDKCGNEDPIIPRMNDLMRLLCVAVLAKPRRLTGKEFRFVRKYLMKTGEEIGRMLGVNKTTVSKWENNEDPIGDQSDRLFRCVALLTGEGLAEKMDEMIVCLLERGIDSERKPAPINIEINSAQMSYRYA